MGHISALEQMAWFCMGRGMKCHMHGCGARILRKWHPWEASRRALTLAVLLSSAVGQSCLCVQGFHCFMAVSLIHVRWCEKQL